MLDKRMENLFNLLSEEEYKTAESFSEKINLSSKTIRTLLKKLDESLIGNGAHIISKSGYGYKLVVEDSDKIKQFKLLHQNPCLPETSEERIQFLLEYLLNNKSYIKIEALSEMLFVSKKTLAQDLKEAERVMKKYNLSIERKPYHGIKVLGEEFDLRLCIAGCATRKIKFNLTDENEINDDLKEIAELIIEAMEYKNFKMSDVSFQNLIIHIHIAIKRIQENNYIPTVNNQLGDLVGDVEMEIAKYCAESISKRFFIEFPKSEIEYIAVHLAGKKMLDFFNNDGKENLVIDQEINNVVNEMLQTVYEAFKFDFRNDLELIMLLGQHLVPLKVRMKFDMQMRNPLLKDIKERLSFSYAMAAQACTVITRHYGKILKDDEIGYIALSIALALERQRTKVDKKNILLVCSSGKGSAQLLVYKLQEAFSEYINKIETCDVRSLNKYDFKDINYIFTTVPILSKVPVPIQQVEYFLDSKDLKAMEKIFHSNKASYISEYYSKDLFLTDVELETKEDVLKLMCSHIKKYKDIPSNFYKAVLKREKLAKTEFGNLVAMPHPNIAITKETFVCVCILKNPIKWDEGLVQIIFLISIENMRNKNLQFFYKITSKLLLNKQYINELIKKKDFQLLQDLLNKIEKDMEDENNG
ncbi:BglG family transcription antiterminator [Clostridium intestinale]|uniref:BglG family transcription antiterminator n=1 Tax=Clostridium intestinale TaxID=36845 RepID=UPI0028E49603|nr:BglG family transcription antiterminator [Clostridium intestinale]